MLPGSQQSFATTKPGSELGSGDLGRSTCSAEARCFSLFAYLKELSTSMFLFLDTDLQPLPLVHICVFSAICQDDMAAFVSFVITSVQGAGMHMSLDSFPSNKREFTAGPALDQPIQVLA